MRTPIWAERLALDALVYLEEQGIKVGTPTLRCTRRKDRRQSSGWASHDKSTIRLKIGNDRTDAKLVLLHEVAHTVTDSEPQYLDIDRAKKRGWWVWQQDPARPIVVRNISHTARFWDIAWQLYRWAKLPIRYCLQREQEYKAGAAAAYHRSRRRQ